MELNQVLLGDCLEVAKTLPDESVNCVVTSPPYFALRDYGADGQIGLENSPEEYIGKLVTLFREIRRVLRKDGTLWVNLGDSYWGGGWRNAEFNSRSGDIQKGSLGTHCGENLPSLKGGYKDIKDKDLVGIPWMFAFAMRADGWYLRQDIIWNKPNPMPESVTDRCVKCHEYIFLFSKSKSYYFDHEAIMEEAVTQIDPRIGQRVEYDGKRDGEEGNGQRAFVSLKVKGHQMGGKKYGENDDPHYATKSGKDYTAKVRYGSGTKAERTHEQGYSEAGGHRDNSGGFDSEMVVRDGVVVRNKRSVWTVNMKPTKEAHFATYPQKLIVPCILAGSPENGVVLDPFMGSGTTGIVARKLNRNFIGIELNPEYQKMATRRIFNEGENLFNQ